MFHWLPLGAMVAVSIALAPRTPGAPRQGASGTITGKVTLTAIRRAPLATSAYGRRDVAPKSSATTPDIRNVVVYVAGTKPAAAPAPVRARIAQRDEHFQPQVAAVTVGSTVEFPNEDPFFHNVFSLSRAASFNLGRYPSGESKSKRLTTAGTVKVFCQLHSQMSAVILVLDHAWFAIPSDDGSFTIAAVPAGERTIVAWHERIGERREKVRIAAGGTTQLSFTLPVLEPDR
jgi:plastocyanin